MTEQHTINDSAFELRFVDDPTRVDDSAGQRVTGDPASDPARHRPRGLRLATVVAATAGLVIAAGAGAVLVAETTSAPDSAQIPAPISPSDQALGYLLSADVPADIDTSARSVPPAEALTPSPADQVLGYLLSADVPALPCDAGSHEQGSSGG